MARERLRYIEDGYTEDGFVRQRRGMFDQDLRFLFRPLTVAQREAMLFKCAKRRAKGDDAGIVAELALQAGVVAKQILEWDYKRPDGKPIPISAESLLKMKPMLFSAVCSIVQGYEPSDLDDEAPHLQAKNDEAEIAEILGGGSTEEFDAKNSEAG